MSKAVFGVLAALATSSLSYASETEEWLGLDKELESLRSTMTANQGGEALGISGFIRTFYTYDSDFDLSGFTLNNVRLDFNATVEDFEIYVQYEAGNEVNNPTDFVGGFFGPERILDAYGAWSAAQEFKVMGGQYRPAFLYYSRGVNANGLFFASRSVNEFFWSFRDQGAEISGMFEQFGWYVGVQNGVDSIADELAYYGRVDFTSGDGIGSVQGAADATEELSWKLGGAVYVDDFFDDATAWAIDGQATLDVFSAWFDVVDYDTDFTGTDDTTFEIAGTVMFVPEQWEGGIRYEDLGDVFAPDLSVLTFGVNNYVSGLGHNAKIQADFAIVDSDTVDTETFSLGIVLGW